MVVMKKYFLWYRRLDPNHYADLSFLGGIACMASRKAKLDEFQGLAGSRAKQAITKDNYGK